MGSTLTKEELIRRVLKATQEVPESTLKLLPMKDLWLVERAITIDKMRAMSIEVIS